MMTTRARTAIVGAAATMLATASLSSLFEDGGWIPLVIGVVAAVTVGCELGAALGRRFGAGPLLRAVGGLLAITFFLCAVYAHPVSPLGFLPSRASWDYLAVDWRDGAEAMRAQTPPVPTSLGLTLITISGVALIALIVNLLSSRPVLAGLPLLTMFVVPVALAPVGVGVVPFALAAAGYLALLGVEGRGRAERWGRPLQHRQRATNLSYGRAGIQIGAAALALAVVVPALVPGLHTDKFFKKSGSGESARGVNPLLTLRSRLTQRTKIDYLTYRSSDGRSHYLRLVADDTFNGERFDFSELIDNGSALSLPDRPRGMSESVVREDVTIDIDIEGLADKWLPAPLMATSVRGVGDDWRFDAGKDTLYSKRTDTGGAEYTVSAVLPVATGDQLAAPPSFDPNDDYFEKYLELPDAAATELTELRDLATFATRNATSQYDMAKQLETLFTKSGGFEYSERTSGTDLPSFVQERRGYCVHFATTMAVMARMLGIPARVNVGFSGGTKQKDGSYVVTSRDAHAWPELYLGEVGWVAFEPTPGGGGGPGDGDEPSTSAPPTTSQAAPSPTASAAAPTVTPPTSSSRDGFELPLALIGKVLAGAALVLALAMPALAHRWRRRRAWARTADDPVSVAHAAWDDVVITASNLGLRWERGLSVRGTAAAIAGRSELSADAQADLTAVVRAEETARYAKQAPALTDDLRAASARVSEALRTGARPVARVRSTVLPRETLQTWGGAVTSALAAAVDVTDSVRERLATRAHRRAPKAAPAAE